MARLGCPLVRAMAAKGEGSSPTSATSAMRRGTTSAAGPLVAGSSAVQPSCVGAAETRARLATSSVELSWCSVRTGRILPSSMAKPEGVERLFSSSVFSTSSAVTPSRAIRSGSRDTTKRLSEAPVIVTEKTPSIRSRAGTTTSSAKASISAWLRSPYMVTARMGKSAKSMRFTTGSSTPAVKVRLETLLAISSSRPSMSAP